MLTRLSFVVLFAVSAVVLVIVSTATGQTTTPPTLNVNSTSTMLDITDFQVNTTTKAAVNSNGDLLTGTSGFLGFATNFGSGTKDTAISRDTTGGVFDFGTGGFQNKLGSINALNMFAGSSGVFGWPSFGSADTGLSKLAANVVGVGNGNAGDASGTIRAAGFSHTASILISSTSPSTTAGNCGGTGTGVTANGTAAFTVTLGSGGSNTCTINLPTAANGWNCFAFDTTNPTSGGGFYVKQTGGGNSTAILKGYNTSAILTPIAAGDVLSVSCFAR